MRRGTPSLVVAASLLASPALSVDCDPPSGVSTCVDANALWHPPGRPELVAIAPAEPTPSGAFAFGAVADYASRPIVLVAASPDPEGREIRVVDHRLDLSLTWAYAPSERLELTLVTPMVLHQTGAGAEGVTSQSAPPIARTAARDPRVGAGYALPIPKALRDSTGLGVKARAELALPLGDELVYAGEQSFVLAPSVAASMATGRFFAGSELGARLRETVHVAGASLGPQLVAALGAGIHILSEQRLSLSAEAALMPTLAAQDRARGDALLVPAEWLAALRSAPFSDPALLLQLGGGTGIPLSSEARADGSTDHYLGLGTPRFRFVLAVRYAPVASGK